MPYSVYFLKNSLGKLYVGQTANLESRLVRHKNDGALFVRNDKSYKLIYREDYPTQLEAMRREKQLKGWTRAKKETLIARDLELLKKL